MVHSVFKVQQENLDLFEDQPPSYHQDNACFDYSKSTSDFGCFRRRSLLDRGESILQKDYDIYVTLFPGGKIKRDIVRQSGDVSLEDTTIQDELIMYSKLSMGPYAKIVDTIHLPAQFYVQIATRSRLRRSSIGTSTSSPSI